MRWSRRWSVRSGARHWLHTILRFWRHLHAFHPERGARGQAHAQAHVGAVVGMGHGFGLGDGAAWVELPGGLLVHRGDHVLHLSADKADVSNADVRARFETLARQVLSRLP